MNLIIADQILLGIIAALVAFLLAFLLWRESNRRREKYFHLLLEYSPFPVILTNAEGKIFYSSRSIKSILGYSDRKLVGRKIEELIHPLHQGKHQKFQQSLLARSGNHLTTELRFLGNNQKMIWLSYAAVNLLKSRNIDAVLISLKDISQRKKVDAQRQRLLEREQKARSTAEAAVRSRDEFLSVATHELKTPLTTILLQIQTTLRRILTQSLANFSGEKLVQSLTIAEQQSQRMSLLIKDLLNVSLITSGQLEINKEKADLGALVAEVINNLQDQIKLSGSHVTLKNGLGVTGQWDVLRLEQCLTNLLTNALKYGRKKPIVVSVEQGRTTALISVKDQGIGISKHDLERIFQPFERTNQVGNIQGLGVGLFIARRIAQAHGGDIRVESRLNHGTTFTLELPY